MSLTILAFDYGTQRIGVALGQLPSDASLSPQSRPLVTLNSKQQKPDWDAISALLEEWQPGLLVVGLPVHMDGTSQPVTDRAKRFGNQLNGRYNLPVEWVDERLSSYEAEQILKETKPRYSQADIDKFAAHLILQSWLDLNRNRQTDN